MDIRSHSHQFLPIAVFFSLIIFPAVTFAANVDTSKMQPKVANVPVPAVKAPVPVQTNPEVFVPPTGPQRSTGAPAQVVTPQVNIKTPTQNVRPATNVTVPTQPRPQITAPGSVKNLPPPIPPNQPRFQPGVDPRYAPRPANQPNYAPRALGNYAPSGVYIPNARRDFGNPAIQNPNIVDPRMQQFRDRQEFLQRSAEMRRIIDLQRAQEDIGNIGGQDGLPTDPSNPFNNSGIGRGDGPDVNEILRDLSGLRGGDFDINDPFNSNDKSGNNAWGRQAPVAGGGVGTNKDKSGWIGSQYNTGSSGSSFKGRYSHDDGSTTVIVRTASPPGEGGSRTSSITLTTTDANGNVTFKLAEESVVLADGTVQTQNRTAGGSSEGIENASEASDAVRDILPSLRGSSEEGTTGEEQGGQGSEVDQGRGDPCGRRDLTDGRCLDTKVSPEQMTSQPGKGDADTGSKSTSIGPAAVTNESEFYSRSGGGHKMLDLKDPPEGGPEGINLDEDMGAIEVD